MALKTLTRQVLSIRQKSLVAPCGIVVSRRMNMNTKPASPAVRGKFVFEYDREKEKFKDVLPIIFDEIIQKHCSDLPETKEHLRHALAARFPFVQVERGMRMLEIYTLSTHPLEITEDTMRGARVIALCGEMIVASFYTLDDMLDNIQTRYGKPAFHLQFPTTAVLDATLLSHVIHLLLQEHIKRRIQVRDAVMDLFHSTTVRTTVGLIQDRLLKDGAVKNPRTAFRAFTIEKYRETVINKIGYMAFSLPIGEILLHSNTVHSKDLSSDERGVTFDLGLDFSGCGLIYAGRPS